MSYTGYVINGGRRASFYGVSVGASQTTLTSTAAVYTCQSQITSDGAKDDAGIITWTLEQIQADSAYWTFVDTAAPATTATAEDLLLEDGVQLLGASSGGTTYAMLVKGNVIKAGADINKTLAWAGLVQVSKSSGSVNFAGTAYVKPTLVAISTKIEQDLVIPSAVMADFATTGSSITILKSTHPYGKVLIG